MERAAIAGLTTETARRCLTEVSPNEIARAKARSLWMLLAAQFGSPLVWLLLGAALVSGFLRDPVDSIAIGAILVINALVGFFQEHRAERALSALRFMTAPRARVVRDDRAAVIPAAEVVPGDVLIIEAGDIVVADGRLCEAHALSTKEAPLTGESMPVEARALAFSTLVFGQIFLSLSVRGRRALLWEVGLFTKKPNSSWGWLRTLVSWSLG